MKNLLTSILCVVVLLSVSLTAHSARISTCTYNGNTKTLKQRVPISRGTFPVDFVYRVDPRYEKAFQRAANALNGSPARLRVNRLKADRIGLYSPGTFYGNKQNDVFLAIGTRGNYKWAAKTKLRVDCKQGALTEADIELNVYASIEAEGRIIYGYDDETFNEVNLAWSGFGPGINWPSVLIHELGHAFGLSHTPDTASNMGYDNPHHYPGLADVVQYYVGEDMADGLVHLYWTKVNKMEGVGISRHVYGFIWGGYARVEMVRVYPYDDNEPYSPYYDDDQRLGTKIPIDTRKIKLAAGLENNGKKKRHGACKKDCVTVYHYPLLGDKQS